MRQIVLDTETTGLEPGQGHRVIEIGAVELLDRRLSGRHFHCYLNPDRAVDPGAFAVHGLSDAFLSDKARFADIATDFLDFVQGAELIIHNAAFDISFLDQELGRVPGLPRSLGTLCKVTDSLAIARQKHPGQKNSLDALCRRYQVDNSGRTLHGALLDAEILADVYLLMTGGQTALFDAVTAQETNEARIEQMPRLRNANRIALKVIRASAGDGERHERMLDLIDQQARGGSVWRRHLQRG
ncbi:MAG: DNA polymerase III subunit epsilon [Pseudomonadales bacterium]